MRVKIPLPLTWVLGALGWRWASSRGGAVLTAAVRARRVSRQPVCPEWLARCQNWRSGTPSPASPPSAKSGSACSRPAGPEPCPAQGGHDECRPSGPKSVRQGQNVRAALARGSGGMSCAVRFSVKLAPRYRRRRTCRRALPHRTLLAYLASLHPTRPEATPDERAANVQTQALPPRPPNRLFTSSKEKPCCVAHASRCVTSTGSGRVRDASSASSGHPA